MIEINSETKVIELAPKVFSRIRELDDISNQDIQNSLDPSLNTKQIFSAGEGTGKSGSFFFFSFDKRFIIKTMNIGEKNTFL